MAQRVLLHGARAHPQHPLQGERAGVPVPAGGLEQRGRGQGRAGEQRLLVDGQPHRRARRPASAAAPGRDTHPDDAAEDGGILRLVGRHGAPAHGRGARHPAGGVRQGAAPAAELLLRRAQGRHHRPHERRRHRRGDLRHQLGGHAAAQPHHHPHLLLRHVPHQLADDAVRHHRPAPGGMGHGQHHAQAEATLGIGAGTVGQHHDATGRDTGRAAHHQSLPGPRSTPWSSAKARHTP